jgi:hypothetical protein
MDKEDVQKEVAARFHKTITAHSSTYPLLAALLKATLSFEEMRLLDEALTQGDDKLRLAANSIETVDTLLVLVKRQAL